MRIIPNKKYIGKILVTERYGFHNGAVPIVSSWGQIFVLPWHHVEKLLDREYVVFVPLKIGTERMKETDAKVYR